MPPPQPAPSAEQEPPLAAAPPPEAAQTVTPELPPSSPIQPETSPGWPFLSSAAETDAPSVPPESLVPPTTPMRALNSATWTVMVASDRMYYERLRTMQPDFAPAVSFPDHHTERRFPLIGNQVRIGRRSPSRDLEPEIDLAGPLADPGVSRLHAILIAASDGTWAVLDPGSANGTLLNGRELAIGDLIPLRDGDRINLGAWTVITVHQP
jgi:FHA domain